MNSFYRSILSFKATIFRWKMLLLVKSTAVNNKKLIPLGVEHLSYVSLKGFANYQLFLSEYFLVQKELHNIFVMKDIMFRLTNNYFNCS